MDISIVYEDEDVVVINKPSGLVVHGDGKTTGPTLVDWIVKKYPKIKGVGEPIELSEGVKIERPGIVHRLDKDTSGALVIAKTQEAFLFLKNQFQNRKVVKVYAALVYGNVEEPVGVIDKPIGRSTRDFRLRTVDSSRGVMRSARTEYRVVSKNNLFSLLEVYPKTGRTHQIRIHLKSIGHPVVCDPLYSHDRACPPELGRLGLHAVSIEFETLKGVTVKVEAPYPDDMAQATRFLLPKA